MQIDFYEYQPPDTDKPVTLGLNISKKYGLTYANLFAISENEGQPISKHFWPIAEKIAKEVLLGENVEDINWAFVCLGRTSSIKFTKFEGQPCKIDLSDVIAVNYENHEYDGMGPRGRWTQPLAEYAKNFDGTPPQDVSKGLRLTLRKSDEPISVFTAPITHPEAKDKLFHCIPSFYDSDHMRDRYVYILADTQKACDIIQQNDPRFLTRQLNASPPLEKLGRSSLTSPDDMGAWTISMHRGLCMSSGYAEYLLLAKDLGVPFFPMAIEKAGGEDRIKNICEIVGYGSYAYQRSLPKLEPAFR